MDKLANIICMKWGDKFPAIYVNRLYGMIDRNITMPFNLYCFTDNGIGIRDEVKIRPLPNLNLPDNIPERGWQKLSVFSDNFGYLVGPVLFLDLDVLIVDNIDSFFEITGDFIIAHDKKRPKKIEGNSSVFRFNIGQNSDILDFFINHFNQIRKEVRHEQAYLSREIHKKGILNYWPDKWVPSFKYHCIPPLHKTFFKKPFIPKGAKIILFHGSPNPPDALMGKSGKWYRFFRSADWIKDIWKE